MSIKRGTLIVTQAVYDDAESLLEISSSIPAIAGVEASQKATECEEAGNDQGLEHWRAVAALIFKTGGDLSDNVEIM
jgi:hypothetical protein